jgi:hypothetical protein
MAYNKIKDRKFRTSIVEAKVLRSPEDAALQLKKLDSRLGRVRVVNGWRGLGAVKERMQLQIIIDKGI